MKKIIALCLLCFLFSSSLHATNYEVNSREEIYTVLYKLKAGDTLYLADGTYKDIKLILCTSGAQNSPIVITAKTGGMVFFTGDVKVELRGEYLVLKDIYFKDGNRNPKEWSSHGPGLLAIYGSYNRITGCVFHAFDEANSSYISTSIPEGGIVPKYCRIDHCVFVEKITFDQVINLNNRQKPEKEDSILGEPMYHRIDHCFFANPKKPGNAGGGIRIGYYRNDIGRCLIDSNLFERQDSEAEIVTSKSQENVFYANTIRNCQGTLNFRHGDRQIAIHNFFINTDQKFEYGGMFVWGSKHIIAGNYFSLTRTIKSRGNAALYLNPGPKGSEHALAFNCFILNNIFNKIEGYAIHLQPLLERRKEFADQNGMQFQLPYNNKISGNIFVASPSHNYPLIFGKLDQNTIVSNYILGPSRGQTEGFVEIANLAGQPYNSTAYQGYKPFQVTAVSNIQGIPLDISMLVNTGCVGAPLTWEDVRPTWLLDIPGIYAQTGKLDPDTKIRFERVIARNK